MGKRVDHYVEKWDGITACGRDSLVQDLDQTRDIDLTTCRCQRALEKQGLWPPKETDEGGTIAFTFAPGCSP